MKAKFLIYFCNGFDSVFDSQVLELLVFLGEKKAFEKIYLFLGVRNELQIKKIQERKLSENLQIVFYRSYPNYAFFNFQARKEISKAIKKNKLVIEECIFHTRIELLAWHLSKIINKRYHQNIIPDIRGAEAEETLEFSDLKSFQMFFKIWNKKNSLKNLTKFKRISVVSEALKNYLTKNHNIKSENILITPCLAGKNFKFNTERRMAIRNDLKLNQNDILIIFSSGGYENWQNNDILKILAKKGMKTLNLSKKEILINNVINRFVDYSQVPLYLNAADIGIIWRDKSIVNTVASPVKFSEYVCCGLPVITNDSVYMISNYIKESSYGLILENLNELDQDKLKLLLSLNREEIATNGLNWLGIEKISQKYLEIYSSFL